MELIYICSFSILLYTYIIYFLVIKFLAALKSKTELVQKFPSITIVVPCYNEKEYLIEKIKNTEKLQYPNKKIIFITDGSDDGSELLLKNYSNIQVLHQAERAGKTMAENRVIPYIDTEITVFTDANSMLNADALLHISKHFSNPKIAAVSGEKKIFNPKVSNINSQGEGLYWKYESKIKKADSDFYTVVGAAGELFAIRTQLYQTMPSDSINDDLTQSVLLNIHGYRISYEPQAFAIESASENVKEELKRKIRMSAGAWQVMFRYPQVFNIFKYPLLSFQFVSHRALRWTLCPPALLIFFISNCLLWMIHQENIYYSLTLICQLMFYVMAFLGYIYSTNKSGFKIFNIAYYFVVMHWAAVLGFIRFIRGKQSVNWERAARMKTSH